MDESILAMIKRRLGINTDTTEFDYDIRSHINSAFLSLRQLGVGPSNFFSIDESTTWDEFTTSLPTDILEDYIYFKVKLVFDPPSSSSIIEAYKDRISELEFRMSIEVDNGGGVVNDG